MISQNIARNMYSSQGIINYPTQLHLAGHFRILYYDARKHEYHVSLPPFILSLHGLYPTARIGLQLIVLYIYIYIYLYIYIFIILIGFGGLEVACWPLVPTFAGSNPAEAVGFLKDL